MRQKFREAAITEAELDAKVLVAEACQKTLASLPLSYECLLEPPVQDKLAHWQEQRLAGMPVGRIIGYREFWGLQFRLSADTLEPRPDTETLVDSVLANLDKKNKLNDPLFFADMGTGSGAIAIALLTELPYAQAIAVDLSLGAAQMAKKNAQLNGVESRLLVVQGNLLHAARPGLDFVVSNPPYIKTEVLQQLDQTVKDYDPLLALDGGCDGLNPYKPLIEQANNIIKLGGSLHMEIGFDQQNDLEKLSMEVLGKSCTCQHDLAGQPRVITIEF